MAKCSKGCMPECEYFTTSGCISQFNCIYKVETGYTNSVTSTPDSLTDLLIEFDKTGFAPTTPCSNSEEYAIGWREKVRKEIERLKSENAELRERLEKAIELPYEVGSTVYIIHETDEEDKITPWIDTGRVVSFSIDVNLWIYVRYNSGLTMWYTKDSFDKEVYITLEAAKARLTELKGEER